MKRKSKKKELKVVRSVRMYPSFLKYLSKKKLTVSQWVNNKVIEEMGDKNGK